MKRGFLNNKKAKNTIFYPKAPEKEATQVSTGEKPIEMKLSYGKVADSDIPKDYKAPSIDVKIHRESEDLSPDLIVITTIPPIVTPGVVHDRTEWITRSATKLKISNKPGFPQPVPKPAQLNYVVKETERMGQGVFATRDIKFGQPIFAERPLLVVPANCGICGVCPPPHYTIEQQKQIMMAEWEKKLKIVVEERMEEEARKAFKELHNSHTEDGSGPILGVIRTNGFSVLGDFDEDDFALTRSYSAIGKIGSRINHSCMPNVRCDFLTLSFSLQFTATKDIKAGEQLFYSYTAQDASAQDRQKGLAPYGMVCECHACANATPETDRLHQDFRQRITSLKKLGDDCHVNLLAERVLQPVFELKAAMEKEGLDTAQDFIMLLCILSKAYIRMGFGAKAEKYMTEATTRAATFHLSE